MSSHRRSESKSATELGESFRRELTSLVITNRSIAHSLATVRTEIGESPEVIEQINELIAVGHEGENHLRGPLDDAGIVLPTPVTTDDESEAPALHPAFARRGAVLNFATEVVTHLRLLAQHLELRARLAAEEARLVGQKSLRQALLAWAAQWRVCGQHLRNHAGADSVRVASAPFALLAALQRA
ncbi:MAG TPA: hypothetical protein VGM73_00270 [Candidatus Didemnitutus sp.]|jgi:predicted membrane chloride channel (bestrophin family)